MILFVTIKHIFLILNLLTGLLICEDFFNILQNTKKNMTSLRIIDYHPAIFLAFPNNILSRIEDSPPQDIKYD